MNEYVEYCDTYTRQSRDDFLYTPSTVRWNGDGGFTMKTHQMFSGHTTPEESIIILNLFETNSSIIVRSSFSVRAKMKRQAFEERFQKASFPN